MRGGGGGGDDEAPPSAKAAADAALPILTTPYLCDVCFGPDIAPHRTRVALAEAAVAGDADLPSHPWLPQGEEPSQQSEVETKMARAKAMKEGAPRKVRLQLLRMSHAAMKGDLAAQMERVASGLQSERPMIARFKADAVEQLLAKQLSPARAVDVRADMRDLRLAADEQRRECLAELERRRRRRRRGRSACRAAASPRSSACGQARLIGLAAMKIEGAPAVGGARAPSPSPRASNGMAPAPVAAPVRRPSIDGGEGRLG